MQTEDCKFVKLIGHLDAVKWLQNPRYYRPSPGYLYLEDWTKNPFTWLHYVESSDGLLVEDEVLLNAYSRYWSIHDVQRYFLGDLHCEKILFTHQYPNLKLPSRLGNTLWKTNTATKVLPKLYLKEFNRSLEVTLKKMVSTKAQMNRLIISDQLINIDCLDYFKRKTFFDYLLKIISFQNELQLVSFENLRCKRLEGVRLVQQLACFNADTLKYLFLWKFVLPNENPLLINYSYLTASMPMVTKATVYFINNTKPDIIEQFSKMMTDEEKSKIAKLLHDVAVKENQLPERCSGLVKDIREKFGKDSNEDEDKVESVDETYENPYIVDKSQLEEIERKLEPLMSKNKRNSVASPNLIGHESDPKRPWRTNSNKEKLLRIDNELKRHLDKATDLIAPLSDGEMSDIIKQSREESITTRPVEYVRLVDTVEEAKKTLFNFQYRAVCNSTATAILREAHAPVDQNEPHKI